MHLEDLPWVISSLRLQVESSLRLQVESSGRNNMPETNTKKEPWWCERDRCWTARAYQPCGQIVRKSMSVSRKFEHKNSAGVRRDLSAKEFQDEKNRKYEEIKQWIEDVELGVSTE